MDWVRSNNLQDFIFHVANERSASPQAGSLLKRKGVLAGVSDILVMKPSGGFSGLFIELKIEGGKVSPAQKKFLQVMNANNYLAVVRYGADAAIQTIKDYLMMSSTYSAPLS